MSIRVCFLPRRQSDWGSSDSEHGWGGAQFSISAFCFPNFSFQLLLLVRVHSWLNPKTGVATAEGAEGADKQQLGNEAWVKVRSQRHKSTPFNIREIREICGSYIGIRVEVAP